MAAGCARLAPLAVLRVGLRTPFAPVPRVARPARSAQALAHRQAHRLHACMAEVANDGAVGAAQQACQRTAEFGRQHLAHVGAVGYGVDAADHGVADDVGAQWVAFAFAAGVGQHGGHVSVKFAQFPFAGMCDFQPEAFCRNLRFDFAVLHQTERVPVGNYRALGLQLANACCPRPGTRHHTRPKFTHHAVVESVVEGEDEDGGLAVEFKLRAQQAVALEGVRGRQRGQTQAFDRALDRLTSCQLQALDSRFQRGGQAMNGVGFHGCSKAPRGGRLVCDMASITAPTEARGARPVACKQTLISSGCRGFHAAASRLPASQPAARRVFRASCGSFA